MVGLLCKQTSSAANAALRLCCDMRAALINNVVESRAACQRARCCCSQRGNEAKQRALVGHTPHVRCQSARWKHTLCLILNLIYIKQQFLGISFGFFLGTWLIIHPHFCLCLREICKHQLMTHFRSFFLILNLNIH